MRFAIVLSLLAGCVTPAAVFECSTSADCSGGTCEPDGLCSFADATCDSGRRYGDGSGGLAGTCVPGGAPAVCGDGVVNGDEECDDGNSVSTDFCVECRSSRCGDGHVLAGVEDCDDGNIADGDTCNANCLACPAGAVTYDGRCYWVVTTAATWDAAAAACAADGGYLASIGSDAENTFVAGLGVGEHWIGLEETPGGGPRDFRWQDDNLLSLGNFTGWGSNEPSTGADDECVAIDAGAWDAQSCTLTRPYVCEREPPIVEAVTKHIYRRFTGEAELDYPSAIAACAALNPPAHLVTITSQAEHDFIVSITDAGRLWIGLDDIETEGTHVWITGEPLSFTAWGPGEPDMVNAAIEDGVQLLQDGTWQTQNINRTFPNPADSFICEIDFAP
jgi:cysteine-rich repeat protein